TQREPRAAGEAALFVASSPGSEGETSSRGSSLPGSGSRGSRSCAEKVSRPRIEPVIEVSCAELPDCASGETGPLGSFTSAGASLVGIQCDGAVQDTLL